MWVHDGCHDAYYHERKSQSKNPVLQAIGKLVQHSQLKFMTYPDAYCIINSSEASVLSITVLISPLRMTAIRSESNNNSGSSLDIKMMLMPWLAKVLIIS